jgi:hypothetical protein
MLQRVGCCVKAVSIYSIAPGALRPAARPERPGPLRRMAAHGGRTDQAGILKADTREHTAAAEFSGAKAVYGHGGPVRCD